MKASKHNYGEAIRELREHYGISRKSLALLLGISEPSIVRYEQGQKPSKSNLRLLELAQNPVFMRTCFEETGHFLPPSQQQRMRERLLPEGNATAFEANGFTERNPERIAAAMNLIATRCEEPYFTRVIKGCFIADFIHFERYGTSLLGLSYAHAPHGPVIDSHALVRRSLEQRGLIVLEDDGLGLLFHPEKARPQPTAAFEDTEMQILDEAARFVDSYGSVKALSDATHELDCWRSTIDGETIPYRRNGQVNALVEKRLYEPNDELVSRLNDLRNSENLANCQTTTLDNLFAEVEG